MQRQHPSNRAQGRRLGIALPVTGIALCGLAAAQLGPPRQIFGPPARGAYLLPVDLDGDGRVDLATFGDQVGWFRNLGGGAFAPAPAVLASTLGYPVQDLAFAAADGDQDGDLDLYVGDTRAVPNSTERRWFLRRIENLGGGAFARAAVVASVGTGVSGMALADLDGDGVLDLVTAQDGDSGVPADVAWQRGLGATSFAARVPLALVADAGSLDASDLDGDGDRDLVVASAGATLVVLENIGGVFTAAATLDASALVGDATHPGALDLDGDGDLDLLLGGAQGGTVWFARTGGTYAAPQVIGAPVSDNAPFLAATARETVAADLDGDGDLDVVSSSYHGFVFGPSVPFGWYPNLGGGAFGPVRALQPTSDVRGDRAPAVLDLDGDGRADVAAAHSGAVQSIGGYRNLGAGAFAPYNEFPVPTLQQARELLAGDVDGDGHLDVLTDLLAGGLWLFRGQGGGAFAAPSFAAQPVFGRAALEDFDGDGDLDLVEFDGSVHVRPNDGAGTFGARQTVLAGLTSYELVDLDGDGDRDLLAVRPSAAAPGRLASYPNLGGGVLGAGIPVPTGGDVVTAATAVDRDNDGLRDIVYTTPNQLMRLMRNLGSGSFGPDGTVVLPAALQVVVALDAADIDADGQTDLVARAAQALVPLRNTGAGYTPFTYTNGDTLVVGPQHQLVDLDLDGQLELLQPYQVSVREAVAPDQRVAPRLLRPEPWDVEIALIVDVDGDGRDDVLALGVVTRVLGWARAEYGVTEALCEPATYNASQRPGRLELVGSTRASDNDVTLAVRDVNPGSACLFVVSDGFGNQPGYRGSLGWYCLDPFRFRLFTGPQQVRIADPSGSAALVVDLQANPIASLTTVAAGTSLGFQVWYRDTRPNGAAATNFTNALRVTFN